MIYKKSGYLIVGFYIILIVSCSSPKEAVMPFTNFKYSGERLFPVVKNDADFTLRVWVNFSTSIDRVFTISSDSDFGYKGKLLEIIRIRDSKVKDKTTFKQINIVPKSGFEKFILKVDSLSLLETKDQNFSDFPLALHEPFSLYVIEIKSHGKTNQFTFRTYFPRKEKVDEKYQKIQDLLFDELPFEFHFRKD